MKIKKLIDKVKNGTINVNLMGHDLCMPLKGEDWHGKWGDLDLAAILDTYHEEDDILFPAHYVKWENYKIEMDKNEVNIGEPISNYWHFMHFPFFQCKYCGEELVPVLYSKNEIRFIPSRNIRFLDNAYDVGMNAKCKNESCTKDGVFTATINSTGVLVFANYFCNEKLANVTDNDRRVFNINYPAERERLMHALAEKNNVGYGQTDDCSGYVYVNKQHDKVLICANELNLDIDKNSYGDSDLFWDDYKNNNLEYCGYISFDVWRWMCADIMDIRKYHKDVDVDNLGDYEKFEDVVGKDLIDVKVIPGKYKIIHTDTNFMPEDNLVWAIIELIKKE